MDRLPSLLFVLSVGVYCVNAKPKHYTQTAVDRTENLVSKIIISNPADIVANTIAKRADVQDDTCTEEYKAIESHTMCLGQNSDVATSGVSKADQKVIVNLHNNLRRAITPSATDLASLVWDVKLAAVAQKWSMQCRLGHDKDRSIPEYGIAIGQNAAAGQWNWHEAIMSWYNEISLYTYGQDPDVYLGKGKWVEIGHFTQIVQNSTFLIGCGYAKCPHTRYGRFYVCNYGAGQSLISHPYTKGMRCSACPKSCNKGLCDCGGKTCLNGGTMDLATCKCSCPSTYKGTTCERLNCPVKDPFFCGTSWPTSYCEQYINVPSTCPYMCGICGSKPKPKPKPKTTTPKPTQKSTHKPTTSAPFISAHGCRYLGKRSSLVECKKLGDHGKDWNVCKSKGGKVSCGHCKRYHNIMSDYCPVMCGLCDPQCNGKKCLHKGTLDTNTCLCSCRAPYSGNNCETANCPENDKYYCRRYKVSYCKQFMNVAGECPYMCGICTKKKVN